MSLVRQLLLRVPDELHAQLASRAGERGESVNSLATRVLAAALVAGPGPSPAETATDATVAVRARAAALGLLVERPEVAAPPTHSTVTALFAGLRATADELLDEQRDPM